MSTIMFGETPYKKINRYSALKEIFYSEEKNNLIIFNQESGLDTESVVNYTRLSMYDLLVETLEEQSGLIVEWYQVMDTSSDFNIFYGLDVEFLKNKGHRAIIKKLKESGREVQYKFNLVIDGVSTPIHC